MFSYLNVRGSTQCDGVKSVCIGGAFATGCLPVLGFPGWVSGGKRPDYSRVGGPAQGAPILHPILPPRPPAGHACAGNSSGVLICFSLPLVLPSWDLLFLSFYTTCVFSVIFLFAQGWVWGGWGQGGGEMAAQLLHVRAPWTWRHALVTVTAKSPSRVQASAALWTVACQAPLSMGFSRQEYWSGLPCPCHRSYE